MVISSKNKNSDDQEHNALQMLGVRLGEAVRFRRKDDQRWQNGIIIGIERDKSIALRDEKGATRSLPQNCIEVKRTGPRGGKIWEPLPEITNRSEQLPLL